MRSKERHLKYPERWHTLVMASWLFTREPNQLGLDGNHRAAIQFNGNLREKTHTQAVSVI
jgi:hypothetical protein